MHFGQTLDAGVVPEWKSQYINYGQGKKLISRLERSMASQSTSWDLPPPAQDLPASVRPGEPAYNSHALDQTPQLSKQQLRRQKILNERSPLLVTPGSSRLYRESQDHQPSANELTSGSITLQDLDDGSESRNQVRKQFYRWMNAEVAKVDKFYTAMEKECQTKLKLLRHQFEVFEEHRKIHHRDREVYHTNHGVTMGGMPQRATTFVESLDFPTMPNIFKGLITKKHDANNQGVPQKVSRKTAHRSDFNNKDDRVGYYQAKSMLKIALCEFYQSLLQLRGYSQLNETAMRKIVKKFDKQLHFNTLDRYLDETRPLTIRSSDKLERVITEVEYLFAGHFTKGNHKAAVESLNIRALKSEETYELANLLTGFLLGAAIPLGILTIYSAIHFVRPERPFEVRYIMQMLGAFVLIGLILVGFGVDLAVWSYYRINYPFIIELDRANMLNPREFAVLPSLYVFFLALCGWLTFNTTQSMHRYYPCLFLGLFVVGLITPFGPYWNARKWLCHSIWRLVFSGLYAVEFRDLLMGDITCSLSYTMSTMELFFCVYGTPHWWSGDGAQHALRCTSRYSRVMGFLNCLPGIWRFLQCIRRFADTLDWFPHLLNAGKYTFTIMYYMSLSVARVAGPDKPGLKAMFIVFALINGVYCGIWDVLMDFSLSISKEPRSVLVYPRWTYYAIMIIDPIMRQGWILYAVFWKNKEEGALISFLVALIEASRRVLWVVFRVENEHAANIARCRAFKNLNLPYDDLTGVEESRSSDVEQQHTNEETDNTQITTDSSEAPPSSQQSNNAVSSANKKSSQQRVPRPPRTTSAPPSVSHSAPNSPESSGAANLSSPSSFKSFRRMSAAFASPLSPRIHFAHTNDFQRSQPRVTHENEEEDEDEEYDEY